MDHSVNAKVIITLLDLYFFNAFFSLLTCTLQTHIHTKTHTDRLTRKVFSDEQAAWGGIRGLTEWPSF